MYPQSMFLAKISIKLRKFNCKIVSFTPIKIHIILHRHVIVMQSGWFFHSITKNDELLKLYNCTNILLLFF